MYYATQVAVYPPTIVLFTNGPDLFDNTYRRYLLKIFRDRLPFREVPIKLMLRKREQTEGSPLPCRKTGARKGGRGCGAKKAPRRSPRDPVHTLRRRAPR